MAGALWEAFRYEMQWRMLLLTGVPRAHFVQPRWTSMHARAPALFPFVRLILAVYWTSWLIAGAIERAVLDANPTGSKWLIALTHWNAVILAIYLWLGAGLALGSSTCRAQRPPHSELKVVEASAKCVDEVSLRADTCEGEKVGIWCQLLWVLHNTCALLQLLVVFFYWGLVYGGGFVDGVNVNEHGVCLALMLLCISLSNIPIRLLHVYQPVAVCMAWVVFSIIYWAFDGTDDQGRPFVYRAIDYEDHPGRAVVVILITGFVGLPAGWIVVWLYGCLLDWLSQSRIQRLNAGAESHLPTNVDAM